MATTLQTVINRILSDIKVELGEEFDRNFVRQGFFAQGWQRRAGAHRADKTLLIDTGTLRRSIRSHISGNNIVFSSDLPYAAIHNEGGQIRVTKRMKAYFWYRYRAVQPAFGRKKNGALRADQRNQRLSTDAQFFKAMALMKEGSTIKIPRRQFIGFAPEVERAVTEIIEENLNYYFDNEFEFKAQ